MKQNVWFFLKTKLQKVLNAKKIVIKRIRIKIDRNRN